VEVEDPLAKALDRRVRDPVEGEGGPAKEQERGRGGKPDRLVIP
jgi:hypothetical protein